MPYQFKDNQNKQYSKKLRLIFAGLSGFIILESIFQMFLTNRVDFHAVSNIAMAGFVIWGVFFNGYYKIMRWYAGLQTKRKDNKFDYFHYDLTRDSYPWFLLLLLVYLIFHLLLHKIFLSLLFHI